MEATGCRLAMTGHSTLVIVSVYLPSQNSLLRRDLRALFALGDAVILFAFPMTSRLQTRLTLPWCSYQPRQDGGRGERAGGFGILGSPEVSADILELIRAKTQLCAARALTPEYRSRRELSNTK
ncbi:hypothetical protein EVAR_34163_1 [Eumeta japonica]|uniref:Uncharacterized protein n=1 Tax=Eumeta variegata TaxID=151549 RepID=A0A4C1WKL4_EUMVA|nr:hypothetical protein EVAR_34163_1 [Eumeta japonica]